MKKFEVMRGQINSKDCSEYVESVHNTLSEANAAAESLADKIVWYGKNSEIKRVYFVYVAVTVTDEEDEWISTDGAVGGYSAVVEGIL